ncbi:MAG: GNAT family N-acetyltransferase [Pseudomonadales bacterium]|nr:GNAT family N-acetyltransferase [Pseudomonadales bacterium]
MKKHYLTHFFEPEAIAIIGAGDEGSDSIESRLASRLREQFAGKVWLVHPRHRGLLGGDRSFDTIDEVPGRVDLAIIVTPDSQVSEQLERCGASGIDSVVVLSQLDDRDGFLRSQYVESLRRQADALGIRMWGPDCYGFVRPTAGIRATLDRVEIKPGKIALISHSGAICRAVTDWANSAGVGFSTIISLEQAAGVYSGDILDYLVIDQQTECILIYAEGVEDSRSFLSGLRGVARSKPVIVMKTGRHIEDAEQHLSHTGAMVGNDYVFNAALERAGIVRANSLTDLFLAARAFPIHRSVRGERIGIISHGLGPAIMACDKAYDLNLPLAELTSDSTVKLAALRSMDSSTNPAYSSRFGLNEEFLEACEVLATDKNVDFLVVVLTPPRGKVLPDVHERLHQIQRKSFKPIVVCCMGGDKVAQIKRSLQERGIPVFSSPENAMLAANYLTTYCRNRTYLIQAPPSVERNLNPDIEGARLIIEGVLQEGRKVLNQMESRAVLKAFDIPISPPWNTHSANEALVAAESLGFPVVLKINSPDISHKLDFSGVSLNVMNAQAVRSAYKKLLEEVQAKKPDARIEGVIVEHMETSSANRELLLGIKHDSVFGPVIVFGHGGTMVEVMNDIAISLPPLNPLLAQTLIASPKVSKMLDSFRNMPAANRQELERIILRLSEIACELPWIRNLDINPLVLNDEKATVVDAVIEVDYLPPAQKRYEHMAIHPYPVYLETHWQMKNGEDVWIRPIRPEDAEQEKAFIESLSERSRYYRFMHNVKRVTPEMLARFTQIDYHREMALVALVKVAGQWQEIGVSRYVVNPDGASCEFAVVVSDQWHRTGIGHKLMELLIEAARSKGLRFMDGIVLRDNVAMRKLARAMGFEIREHAQDEDVVYIIKKL